VGAELPILLTRPHQLPPHLYVLDGIGFFFLLTGFSSVSGGKSRLDDRDQVYFEYDLPSFYSQFLVTPL